MNEGRKEIKNEKREKKKSEKQINQGEISSIAPVTNTK